MTQYDTCDEIIHARAQGLQAVQKLAESHLPLVALMVRRCPKDGREPEELYQQGCVGLMKAIARYDPGRGVTFSTYAASMILGEMRMLYRLNAPIHIPRPERELRQRIRKAQEQLTIRLHREPNINELASVMRMDPAELVLMTEEITVTSSDALNDSGTPLQDMLPDDEDWQSHLEMLDLIRRLPDTDQQLLTLRLHEGLTQSETARRMGLTQLQVSRREAVIRRTLQKQWQAS